MTVQQLQARLDQALLLVRIADLHAGAFDGIGRLIREPGGREYRYTTDTVTAGGRAQQDRQVADALGPAEHQALHGHDAQGQHVHERVVRITLVEHRLPAHGRHPHGVAVPGDARDDALGDPARAGVVEWPEAQGIHQGDRAGPHREDVAQDATGARGRALVGLDRRRMVVALDADRCADPVTDVDDAGALAGSDQDPRGLGRETLQVDARALVGTVLGPHDREHGEFQVVRLPVEDLADACVLVIGQSESAMCG